MYSDVGIFNLTTSDQSIYREVYMYSDVDIFNLTTSDQSIYREVYMYSDIIYLASYHIVEGDMSFSCYE